MKTLLLIPHVYQLPPQHPQRCQRLYPAGLVQPVEISFALLLQQYSLSVVSSLPWSVLLFYLCWAGSNNTLRTDGATRARFPTAQQRAAWPPRAGIQQSAGPCQVLPTPPKNRVSKAKHTLCPSPNLPVPTRRVRHLFSWANCFPPLQVFVFQSPGWLQTCRRKTNTQHSLGKAARFKGVPGKGASGTEGGCRRPGRSRDNRLWPSAPAGDLAEEPAPAVPGSQASACSLPLQKHG